jgi:hypothetical protein
LIAFASLSCHPPLFPLLGQYVLDFCGRAPQVSVKNFQLVYPEEPDEVSTGENKSLRFLLTCTWGGMALNLALPVCFFLFCCRCCSNSVVWTMRISLSTSASPSVRPKRSPSLCPVWTTSGRLIKQVADEEEEKRGRSNSCRTLVHRTVLGFDIYRAPVYLFL